MTRDEAYSIVSRAWEFGNGEARIKPRRLLDAFVALGILKLDEPKPPKTLEARLAEALGWPEGGRSHGELITALVQSGLKIVEK